jgi:anti-sigma factor RsiW
MSHPLELLVSFEDGTLQPAERAVLDAHLAGCARCAAEVEAATAARAALRATALPGSINSTPRERGYSGFAADTRCWRW